MEIKRTDLKEHAKSINRVLQEVCGASGPGPFVGADGIGIYIVRSALTRDVTPEMGPIEVALALPVPDAKRPQFWIGIIEQWEGASKKKIRFRRCGLRLYYSEVDEEPLQVLRLEWVAPTSVDHNAEPAYEGKNAGHPHWHIDRAALLGPERAAVFNAPESQAILEDFTESTIDPAIRLSAYDSSWIQRMHLPAQADWMRKDWNGKDVPGPHQCEPGDLQGLNRWWDGALRYLVSELPR
jgi:hypothetical protein